MLINTFLDTEDFVHLYYPEDETPGPQGCGAGARLASKYPRPPTPEYKQVVVTLRDMGERERHRAQPQPEPPPVRVRAADLYPRVRTHYDEPGLDAGFPPICGEFVQWVGRTRDDGTIAMSNYRLHLQPQNYTGPGASIPLRLIDALEMRTENTVCIICKHGRQLICSFATNEQSVEWCRRLNTALVPFGSLQDTFAAAYTAWARELPPSSIHRALLRASQAPQRHWFGTELERLGFTDSGAWRVSIINTEYRVCPTYPPLVIVPSTFSDEKLQAVARFRALHRFPAVVWRHPGTGAVIARAGQPEVGWFGWRSEDDEQLIASFVTALEADRPSRASAAPGEPGTSAAAAATGVAGASAPAAAEQPAGEGAASRPLLIVDARSFTSAVTNRARGGGYEAEQYYTQSNIQFMNLANIHNVRRSFQSMLTLCFEEAATASFYSSLERSMWLHHVSYLVQAASVVARALEDGRPVLVHCSDGWDRTPQIVAIAELMLDPYYRTVQGFRIVIEREWLDFGHKFADRCGHRFGADNVGERSPIFLQWLHVVYQLMVQFPCSFEFNEAYLIKLATHVHSCMFGTFLCNTSRERTECRATDLAQVWQLLRAPAYRNHLYTAPRLELDQVLWPDYSVRAMHMWWGLLRGERALDLPNVAPSSTPVVGPSNPSPNISFEMAVSGSTNVSMNGSPNASITKTKSCDDLLKEEKKTPQRRSSDPALFARALNALSVPGFSTPERSEDENSPLTDSCVERLPRDQADLQPGPPGARRRVIASNSPSMERELAASPCPGLPASSAGLSAASPTAPPDSPDDMPELVGDPFTDVHAMAEAARETARMRHISITWRSISESSNQSLTGLDAEALKNGESPGRAENENGIVNDPENSIANDHENDKNGHKKRISNGHNGDFHGYGNGNGDANSDANADDESDCNGDGDVDVPSLGEGVAKILEGELNADVHAAPVARSSSGSDSDSSVRAERVASQLTLCPASPRRAPRAVGPFGEASSDCQDCVTAAAAGLAVPCCPDCSHFSEGAERGTRGASAGGRRGRVRCSCGAGARLSCASLDGLPPAADPLQARLHQIILSQRRVVEELSEQLREAREALRRASPSLPPAYLTVAQPQPETASMVRSRSGSGSAASRSGSVASSSGSASEVEVGEEARGVHWLPDSAAPRCQHCCRTFWLARRRHHCRRCGGIFCSSCSEMSQWGETRAVRVCRRCLR